LKYVEVKNIPGLQFCRRVGPRKERDRPLVVVFLNQATRARVLRADYGEDGVGPDMTKKQCEEETEVWK
jgi:hypothetical protein